MSLVPAVVLIGGMVIVVYVLMSSSPGSSGGARLSRKVSPSTEAPASIFRLTADISVPSVLTIQAELDCWFSTDEGGAWVERVTQDKRGYLYDTYLDPNYNTGSDSYHWVPGKNCTQRWPADWDVAHAARVLTRFGGIMFVGDSVMHQEYYSMMSALNRVPIIFTMDAVTQKWAYYVDGEPRESARVYEWPHSYFFLGPVPMGFTMNVHAKWAHNSDDSSHWYKVWMHNWAGKIHGGTEFNGTKYTYKVLILNRGLHAVQDAVFLDELNQTLFSLQMEQPNLLTIWRPTMTGSVNCEAATGKPPLKSISKHVNIGSGGPSGFHWEAMGPQNELARKLIQDRYPHVLILDATPALSLRPGSRAANYKPESKDCLHWGMPGPLDLWTVALTELISYVDKMSLKVR